MSSTVVVDASTAIKWVVVESDSPLARALLAEWQAQGYIMLAPVLFAYEVTNILRQQVRKGTMTASEAEAGQLLVFAQGLSLDTPDQAGYVTLNERALNLTNQLNLLAAYDAQYLALAERERCEYWTADQRLWNAVKTHVPWVRWLGERTASAPATTPPAP